MTQSNPQGDLSGMRALVTGASSGIGRATSLELARRGARVIATARRESLLRDLVADGAPGEGEITPLAGDIVEATFRQTLVRRALEHLGGLDILVNAAGIIATADWEKTTLPAWQAMMDVNLTAVFGLCQQAIPHLQRSRGSIVNVSSVTGTRAFPNVLAYCVSKAGVDQLTRCLALELAASGVRVNAVNPGVVRTNLHRASGMDAERYAAFLAHSTTTHPLGRVGEPEDVAALIVFLASPASGWITGETIAIDGGRAQTCAR